MHALEARHLLDALAQLFEILAFFSPLVVRGLERLTRLREPLVELLLLHYGWS